MRTLLLKLFLIILALGSTAELVRYNADLYKVQAPDGFIFAILGIGFILGFLAWALISS